MVTVRIFNNRQIIISLHYEASSYSVMSNNLSNYVSRYSLFILYFFCYVLFLSNHNALKIITNFCVWFFLFLNIVAPLLLCLCSLLLTFSGDVETNPGPLSNCKEYFSICNWNLNSVFAHDYSKLFLLKAYYTL